MLTTEEDPDERPEPSEAVSQALAETLESSGELNLDGADGAPEELDAEELAEHELEEDDEPKPD